MSINITVRGGAIAVALTVLATPAMAQDRFDWGGGRSDERDYQIRGAGERLLIPELRRTSRGRAFVMRNFDLNDDRRISPREADAANRAFIRIAGGRGDRFDWEGRDVRVTQTQHRDWDRRGMRGYRMRQTQHGATFDLQDVLFETGSARLKPGAAQQLRPLVGYLNANDEVRVRIDGHTDSVGSDAANQLLSERRAATVRATLGEMNVEEDRFEIFGHGEAAPTASNANATGRQLNRRVEVTLLGQEARSFTE